MKWRMLNCMSIETLLVSQQAAGVNLRADDSSDKCSPRQFAVGPSRHHLAGWTKTGSIFLTTWSTGATIRSSKNGDSNESTDKAEVQEHQ